MPEKKTTRCQLHLVKKPRARAEEYKNLTNERQERELTGGQVTNNTMKYNMNTMYNYNYSSVLTAGYGNIIDSTLFPK